MNIPAESSQKKNRLDEKSRSYKIRLLSKKLTVQQEIQNLNVLYLKLS